MKNPNLETMQIFPVIVGGEKIFVSFDALKDLVDRKEASREEKYLYLNMKYIFKK